MRQNLVIAKLNFTFGILLVKLPNDKFILSRDKSILIQDDFLVTLVEFRKFMIRVEESTFFFFLNSF